MVSAQTHRTDSSVCFSAFLKDAQTSDVVFSKSSQLPLRCFVAAHFCLAESTPLTYVLVQTRWKHSSFISLPILMFSSLQRNLTELKSFGSPVAAVTNVTAAIMVLTAPGGRVPKDRTWKAAKVMMAKVDGFLDSLMNFNKENIPESSLNAIQPYLQVRWPLWSPLMKVSSYSAWSTCYLVRWTSQTWTQLVVWPCSLLGFQMTVRQNSTSWESIKSVTSSPIGTFSWANTRSGFTWDIHFTTNINKIKWR